MFIKKSGVNFYICLLKLFDCITVCMSSSSAVKYDILMRLNRAPAMSITSHTICHDIVCK